MIKRSLRQNIQKIMSKFGIKIVKVPPPRDVSNSPYRPDIPAGGIFYKERQEAGAKNLSIKLERVKNGGDFEWPNIVALNQVVANFIGDSKRIVNIGSGTGAFEWFASVDSSLNFVASEFDSDCIKWCKENRQRPNIEYCGKSMKELMSDYKKFDMAVCVDVIEHIADFSAFLADFSALADKAILTTPNRDRTYSDATASSPEYYQHVREWDAGEFYWILRCYYKQVKLYAMPNVFLPEVAEIGFLSTMTPLIAVCRK